MKAEETAEPLSISKVALTTLVQNNAKLMNLVEGLVTKHSYYHSFNIETRLDRIERILTGYFQNAESQAPAPQQSTENTSF